MSASPGWTWNADLGEPETEVEDLWPLDVGIMPLTDDPWTAGKCAMKAIQYLGVGIPAVVSPIGANRDVIEDGVTGFHARSEERMGPDARAMHGRRGASPTHGGSWSRGCRRSLLGRGSSTAHRVSD